MEEQESFSDMVGRLEEEAGADDLGPEAKPEEAPVEKVAPSDDEYEDVADLAEAVALRGSYVVSIVGRSGRRTLHKVGECYRLPGVHFKNFETMGESMPDAGTYHVICKVCFPKSCGQSFSLDVGGQTAEVDESSGEDISSSDSGSEASGP